MATKNQDTPAYAVPSMNYFGLTKLEAFTMAAMQGLCANSDRTIACKTAEEKAQLSVIIAKETLNELEKPEGGENDKS